jgi:uncharacterized FAD-dependent dehydrogenase
MDAKSFSVGFRVEHPKAIDRAPAGAATLATQPQSSRLQAGAPRQQRPLGVQLLHVSGWDGGGEDHLRPGRVVTNGMSQCSQ